MIFDTHVHFNDEVYENVEKEISEARESGVSMMAVIGFDLPSSKKAIEIANKYKNVYAVIGIHPDQADKDLDNDLKELEKLCKNNKVVAIGEIGLDYHYGNENKERQKKLFVDQLEMAKRYNLPIVIHSRDAAKDTYDILKGHEQCYKKGIMHCYSYSLEMVNMFNKLGFYIGVGGVVTFKNARTLKEIVEQVSLDKIVLETDAPYLAPAPHRGEINRCKYITEVAKEVALIKSQDISVIEDITFSNACNLYGVNYEED